MCVLFLVSSYRPGGQKEGPFCFFRECLGHAANAPGRRFTLANHGTQGGSHSHYYGMHTKL